MSYAIEVDFPNIRPWERGNTGLPYVWSFRGDAPGPHVCVVALVHGNEVCGAIAADALLHELAGGRKPLSGMLSVVFANVAAYESFNRDKPLDSRYVDEDFNRLWNETTLDGPRDSHELKRARALRPFFDTVDHLLDLHSMSEPAPPISLAGDTEKGLALAKVLGSPAHILVDSGHVAGKRLRDYAGFGDPASRKTALLIECGQHWERNVGAVACDAVWRFLRHFGMLERDWLDQRISTRNETQRVVDITTVVTVQTEQFAWQLPVRGLQVFANAGTAIATDGAHMIRTPHDEAVLVMPVLKPEKGKTAVRIGRFRTQRARGGRFRT